MNKKMTSNILDFMSTPKENPSYGDLIAKYWFLIFFVGGMIVTWVRFEFRIAETAQKIQQIEQREVKSQEVLIQLQGDIREIKTSLLFIIEKIR